MATMDLKQFFKQLASECRYAGELDEALLKWSYMKIGGTVWEIVEDRITSQAAKFNMTPEKYVDYLFEAKDASEFMSCLEE